MDRRELERRIGALGRLGLGGLRQADLLLSWDRSREEVLAILEAAEILAGMRAAGVSPRIFDSGLAVSIFRDKSTRTRFSFAAAADLLGLSVQELEETKSQIAHGETVRETANMISFLAEVIGIRDDIYLGEGHRGMLEVSAAVREGFREGVLPQVPVVVNLQCDLDHPTQSLADLLHLVHAAGGVENLRGRKLAVSWAYSPSYGKPLSVPQGVIALMSRFGMEVVLAHPEGYRLIPEVEELAERQARESGGSFRRVSSMEEAFSGADFVYPKSWAPYAVMQRRTELLRAGDRRGLSELEGEALAENSRHLDWECGEALMARTKEALYLHCLPADISGVSCEHGEVAASVFERFRIATYRQAGYKPYIIAAAILLAKASDPVAVLELLAERAAARVR